MAEGRTDLARTLATAGLLLLLAMAVVPAVSTADPVVDGTIAPGEYAFNQSFQDDLFHLLWTIEGDTIHLAIEARTTGWIALGLEPTVIMQDADMIIGWWNSTTDFQVVDAFSTGQTGPHPPDTEIGGSYDILTWLASQSGGWTRVELTRKLATGDHRDHAIRTDGTMSVMWAVSDTREYEAKHAQRGLAEVDFGSGEAEEVEAPVLWPYHAALMTTGTVLFVATYASLTYRKLKKKWWLEAHHYVGTAAVVCAVAGLSIGFVMVGGLEQGHLRVMHSFIGATTLTVGLACLAAGSLFMWTKRLKRASRRPHIALGVVGIAMMVVTVVSGLMYVFP